jgi:phospholipase/carboxylesterase
MGLAPYLAKALPGAYFISPNAIESLPQMAGAYQWFPITQLDPRLMEAGVRHAAPALDRFLDRELERQGLPAERLVLVGFSQGTMMALHVGLRRKTMPAAVLGYSGVLVGPKWLKEEVTQAPPVLLVHGDQDGTIPIPAMFESAEALAASGFSAQWHVSYGVPHSIGPDGLDLGGAFLANQLKTKRIVTAA